MFASKPLYAVCLFSQAYILPKVCLVSNETNMGTAQLPFWSFFSHITMTSLIILSFAFILRSDFEIFLHGLDAITYVPSFFFIT